SGAVDRCSPMGKIWGASWPEVKSERPLRDLGEAAYPLAKVGVEGSNPFARSNFSTAIDKGSAVSSHVDAISV
ncbi:MAG: hypothetical protein WBE29_01475, partial [Pseudolabrys sp.]